MMLIIIIIIIISYKNNYIIEYEKTDYNLSLRIPFDIKILTIYKDRI